MHEDDEGELEEELVTVGEVAREARRRITLGLMAHVPAVPLARREAWRELEQRERERKMTTETKAPSGYDLGSVARARVGKMLDVISKEKRPCRLCQRTIWMLETKTGKAAPYDDDAVNHFASCPHANEFRKKK